MQKFFLVSLLAAAGMVYGCGYGDGKEVENQIPDDNNNKTGPLPQLATSCKTNAECKIGKEILGDCVAGVCRRFCDTTADCEKDTICEGGVCRPVEDCMPVTFEDESKNKLYANKKCVKVFNITPSVAWSQLLTEDLVFNKENTKLFGKDTDFTSKDFAFELPHSVITKGLNFSMVTYIAVNYLKLMITSASALAQCTKPQVKVNGQYVNVPRLNYSAKYMYSMSNDEITPKTMISICDDATYHMDDDMEAYINYLNANELSQNEDPSLYDTCSDAENQIECAIEKYQDMIINKPTCELALRAMTVVRGFSNILMQIGMTAANSSSSYEGAVAMSQWLTDIQQNTASQFVYQTDFDKTNESYGANQLDLDCAVGLVNGECKSTYALSVLPLSKCDYTLWRQNVLANDSLYRQISDTNTDEYMKSPKRIRFCNEIDATSHTFDNQSEANDRVKFGNKYYQFDPGKANEANIAMLKTHAMKSQLSTCVYMMKGTYDFSLMKAMSSSKDIQLGLCGTHEKLKDATVNVSMLPDDYKEFFTMLDDLQGALTNLTDLKIASMSSLLSVESLYSKATDPSYIWLSGENLFPLAINHTSGDFTIHDLILDIVYRPTSAMFETTSNSRTPLAESIKFTSYQDDYVNVNGNDYTVKEDSEVVKDYIPTFTYSNTNKESDSHAIVLYRKNENKNCPNGKCTFYWKAKKADDAGSGLICGGMTLVLDHADGYIVLKDSDIIGSREVASNQQN